MSADLVTFPRQRRRVANATANERCRHCADEAIVLVDEAAAPCPFCERGFRVEFGIGRDDRGNEYERPEGGPWGKDGFWRDRPIPEGM